DAPTPASGLGAMYTDEGSWFAGAFHQDYLADDRFRLLIVVGAGKVHLAYYGEGSGAGFADDPVTYALRSFVTRLDTRYRLPWTEHWYLGPSYFYGSGEVGFGMDVGSAELPDLRGRFQNAGLGLSLTYDTRDDSFYPTAGLLAELAWVDYRSA